MPYTKIVLAALAIVAELYPLAVIGSPDPTSPGVRGPSTDEDWLADELRRLAVVHYVVRTGDESEDIPLDRVALKGCQLTIGVTQAPSAVDLLRANLTIDLARYGEDPQRVEVAMPANGKGPARVRIATFDLPPLKPVPERTPDGRTRSATLPRHIDLYLYEDDLLKARQLVAAIRQRALHCSAAAAPTSAPSN